MLMKQLLNEISYYFKNKRLVKKTNKLKKCNFSKDTIISQAIIEGFSASRGYSYLHRSKVGLCTYFGKNVKLPNCLIGRFCSLGSNIEVVDSRHPIDLVSTYRGFYDIDHFLRFYTAKKYYGGNHLYTEDGYSCKIGNDVWIGNNVIIKGGVTISDGAVIGMGTIVTKDVPPYAVVAGNPMRILKYRFEEKIIEKLLVMKWWNWELQDIKDKADLFLNVDDLLKRQGENER